MTLRNRKVARYWLGLIVMLVLCTSCQLPDEFYKDLESGNIATVLGFLLVNTPAQFFQ
jgi:hypothetical protein